MSYDKKLRKQALKYRETHTQKETSETFGISASAIKDWQKQMKETGKLENKPLARSGRKIKETELRADVEKYPDDFNWERAERFDCSEEGIRKAMKRHKITRKKRG